MPPARVKKSDPSGAKVGGGLVDGPLAGLLVVDLTRVLSGPYCTMLLLTDIMGSPELGLEPRPTTNEQRLAHAPEVYELVEAWTGHLPTAAAHGEKQVG